MEPRGIRNNNPGNIRLGRVRWQGQADDRPDPEFCTFTSPEYGIRAMARTLLTYEWKYRCRTVADFIGRWAPPAENDTAAYAAHAAEALGVQPDEPIELDDGTLAELIAAIIRHENGKQPYPAGVIADGIRLARGPYPQEA